MAKQRDHIADEGSFGKAAIDRMAEWYGRRDVLMRMLVFPPFFTVWFFWRFPTIHLLAPVCALLLVIARHFGWLEMGWFYLIAIALAPYWLIPLAALVAGPLAIIQRHLEEASK